MKNATIWLWIQLISACVFGQSAEFNLREIKFNGLGFSEKKDVIIKTLGKGKIAQPEYECGFYSNDQPGGPFYQIIYPGFNYIGSDKERFILEIVSFDPKGEVKMKCGDEELSGLTTRSNFIKIFGEYARKYFEEHPDDDSILLHSKGSDDGGTFIFKNGKLVRFRYWSPC
jgi:hypothetical protein